MLIIKTLSTSNRLSIWLSNNCFDPLPFLCNLFSWSTIKVKVCKVRKEAFHCLSGGQGCITTEVPDASMPEARFWSETFKANFSKGCSYNWFAPKTLRQQCWISSTISGSEMSKESKELQSFGLVDTLFRENRNRLDWLQHKHNIHIMTKLGFQQNLDWENGKTSQEWKQGVGDTWSLGGTQRLNAAGHSILDQRQAASILGKDILFNSKILTWVILVSNDTIICYKLHVILMGYTNPKSIHRNLRTRTLSAVYVNLQRLELF